MKKPRDARFLSALLMVALASSSIAHAMPVDPPATFTFEEVPEVEADRIAPITSEFWDRYSAIGTPQIQSFDMGAIIIGTIALDALVNIGKAVWAVIEAGRPKMNFDMDVASAVPQGIKSWTELDSWKDPIAKLYRTQLYSAHKAYIGDVYYRLIFTYGGHYKGVGSYLTNVTIMPAQLQIPYRKNFYAQAKVTELVNHGTQKNPIAGMTLNLNWGMEGVFSKSMQSISFHVRGDGKVIALPSQDDTAETVRAPVTTSKPTPKAKPAAKAPPTAPAAQPTPKPTVVMVRIVPSSESAPQKKQ